MAQLIMEPTTNGLNELLMGSVHLQQLEEEAAPDEQYKGKEKTNGYSDVSIWSWGRGFLTSE